MFKFPKLPTVNLFPKKKPNEFLTLDIGTDFVKCFAFKYNQESQNFSVVGLGKQRLANFATRAGVVVDFNGVKEAASLAILDAKNQAQTKTNNVIIGLSGEVTKGLVTTVRLTRPHHESPISDKELAALIARIQETAYLEASKEIIDMTGNPDLEIELTNSSISWVKLDDHFVKDPVNMPAKKMEVALFTAFSPTFHLELLQKLCKELKLNIITVTSEMYALSKCLSVTEGYENVILIDIGGETTDVGVIFGGGLVATRTLSLGGRHITRAISECFSLSIEDAEEKKLMYTLGTLSVEESASIRDCIKDSLDLWLSGLEVLFLDFNGIKTFPSKIVITGGGSSLRGLDGFLAYDSWLKNIQFKETPIFEKASLNSLIRVSDLTGKATTGDDIMPASLSEVYLEMEGN